MYTKCLQYFAIMWIVMSRMTKKALCRIFTEIQIHIPNFNPKLVITFYYKPMYAALREAFGEIEITGSSFYYSQVSDLKHKLKVYKNIYLYIKR